MRETRFVERVRSRLHSNTAGGFLRIARTSRGGRSRGHPVPHYFTTQAELTDRAVFRLLRSGNENTNIPTAGE